MRDGARVVVVGGGIAGLSAATELSSDDRISVSVCEAGDRPGGKIRTERFAGMQLDLGPDSFLARRPEAIELCRELGLEDDLVAPATGTAWLWAGDRLNRLPTGLALGVPTDMVALARSRILSPLGLLRAVVEPVLPGRPLTADRPLGQVVRRRLGGEVHRRLVDPLVGGINAGNTDRLSIEVAAPTLAAAGRRHRSLVLGARALQPSGRASGGAQPEGHAAGTSPVFMTLPGGLGRLVDRLVARLTSSGVEVRTGDAVTAIERRPDGGYLVASRSGPIVADAVVLATPAPLTASLLFSSATEVARLLADIEYASVALVAMAFPREVVDHPLDGSGFLVARGEGRLMTACSWMSSKWGHLATSDRVLVRVSAGRAGDERATALDDADLVARLCIELGEAMGITAPPSDIRVARWPDAFPQYEPGHRARMAAASVELAERHPGLALAGAYLDGVGLPACIASGRAAARHVLSTIASNR